MKRVRASWIAAAVLSLALLGLVLGREYLGTQKRFAVQVSPRPETGRALFAAKGCAGCHGAKAEGTANGPALRRRGTAASLPQLVTAMWNHAPRMWAAMEAQKISYPQLSYEETAQLISFLYISGYADNQGDADKGEALFAAKRCNACHRDPRDRRIAASLAGSSPLDWTQALWNHAAGMRARMREKNITWPRFQSTELRDLYAFARRQNGDAASPASVPAGDPSRGWRVFQERGCVSCHGPSSSGAASAPTFGPDRPLPPTFSEFGAALLNHVPQMEQATAVEHLDWPKLQGNDLNDLVVFVYSLHYLEPSGSPQVGRSVFAWRGCDRCHGAEADGGSAPALRGRGQTYTAARLATDLWKHGASMYRSSQTTGQPWPMLQESDIGNLLAFLNTPREK
jgi:mono/diheme cytochrome c family protein